ncbi:hypothetical protein D9615_007888 [Tricholomella constricta]|uniref:Uncharacterized protein n=1 Tax=Tricholomella constricta TaxID=117010 RepID=A0A8H5H495_9AGAR|nr:hypothetical protein D9615_007888 [Tricholomella constricta]
MADTPGIMAATLSSLSASLPIDKLYSSPPWYHFHARRKKFDDTSYRTHVWPMQGCKAIAKRTPLFPEMRIKINSPSSTSNAASSGAVPTVEASPADILSTPAATEDETATETKLETETETEYERMQASLRMRVSLSLALNNMRRSLREL